jgi:hypothetical protein
MTAFKPGDKVLIHARMGHPTATDGVYFVTIDCGRIGVSVPASALLPAPKPLYVDPELVPGMVVAPLDAADDREWWVVPSVQGCCFIERSGSPAGRNQLPDEIRVVRPREATS